YFKPFEHGVDVSVQAGTKYIGGHSDILLGTITTTDEHIDKIFKTYKHLGVHTDPDICYMAIRGIRTMPTRLKAHEQSALNIAKWLEKRPEVAKVLHPALPSCPGHKLWTGSTGLFTIILDKNYSFKALSNMIDNYEIFGIGSSWGGFESLAINFDPTAIRTAGKWTEKGSCVRLFIGLEDEGDLIKDLEAGFKRLKK
ncbi:MAG: cystathionine beta-lyase, partial [Rickettsiaceae bacterium]|nr:cystathionine beta-lyase [Rickettsiaceae bacterium]